MGAHIGYWRGNVKLLMEDVAELRPTLFVAVPRILERVEDGGGCRGWLVARACVCVHVCGVAGGAGAGTG